jgi:hypothetical protein
MIGGYRVLYDAGDLERAEAAALNAVDGRLSLADAQAVAIAVLESIGLERKETPKLSPPADDLPEVRG